MGVMIPPTEANFQRLTPYESSVRSTALAYRFMVRRSLSQFRGAEVRGAPAETLVRVLDRQCRKATF